ncbi:unnamed protein product [Colias eurytheme]|nr:unnamed protein product [Colias eurytheme]
MLHHELLSLARRAFVAFSIYSCIGRAQVLCAGRCGPGGHTYYVINPRPPRALPLAWAERGTPYERRVSSSPRLTAHGHSLRTELLVVPPPVALRPAPTSHLVRVYFYIIHANLRLIFLLGDRSETRYRECRMLVDVTLVYFSIGIQTRPQNQFGVADGAFG